MVRCFIVRVWVRIPSNNALHEYFSLDMPYNRRVMESCGLDRLPDKRTFDRRFKAISIDIRSRIGAMDMFFIKDGLVDPAIVSVDSSLLKAKGHLWHRSNMKKNEVPRSGIDTDARWGYSRTKGWVFGYKMHLACSTGSLIVPLSADFTTANITDNKMYESITSSLPTGMVRYVVGDEGYDVTSYVISAGIEGIQYSHWKGIGILQIIIDWHCCSSITLNLGSMYILGGA